MTGVVVNFPAFASNEVRPLELRALVKAIEHRFRGLEQDTFITLSGEDFSIDDLDARYASSGHLHSEDDIGDLQSYLTTINDQSIFDLSDVSGSGSPSNNDILVWNEGAGEFQLTPFTIVGNAFDSLEDVHVPDPDDQDTIIYNAANSRWEASAVGAGVTVGGEQSITGEKTLQADLFMDLNTDEGIGETYRIWWGEVTRRFEMYNDADADTGGFWFNFESGHLEPSIRIGVNGNTSFWLDTVAGFRAFDGLTLRAYDSGNTDYIDLSHDGTDALITLLNAGSLNFTGVTDSYTFDRTLVSPASVAARASVRIPHGAAPTSPVNGDVWSTTTAMYGQVNSESFPLSFDGPGKVVATKVWSLHEWGDGTTRSNPE